MATTMKALRKMRPARALTLDAAPLPSVGPTEVLVRVKAACICGTGRGAGLFFERLPTETKRERRFIILALNKEGFASVVEPEHFVV